jgi:hypothetical protein
MITIKFSLKELLLMGGEKKNKTNDIQNGQESTPLMAGYIYAWMYNKMQSESAVPPITNLI